jgi:hypothetical protein
MSEENKHIQEIEEQESSIDFGKIFKDLLKHKKLYYKVLPIAFVLAAIYSLGQPNYYKCEVVMSPELSTRRSTNSLASLASSMGINLSSGMAANSEALFPTVYPELINSVTFHTSLFNIKVHRDKEKKADVPQVKKRPSPVADPDRVEEKLRTMSRHYTSVHPRLHQNGTMPGTAFKVVAYVVIALLLFLLGFIIYAGSTLE